MFEIKNFDDWIEDIEYGKFGSGASEKVWLINPKTNEKGLFKFPKVKDKEIGNNIINKDMKRLLKMYLLERRKRMLQIYNLKDEE